MVSGIIRVGCVATPTKLRQRARTLRGAGFFAPAMLRTEKRSCDTRRGEGVRNFFCRTLVTHPPIREIMLQKAATKLRLTVLRGVYHAPSQA